MILGVGVDMVNIGELSRLVERLGEPFINKTFTAQEVRMSVSTGNRAKYFAERFAAKEALFKAIQHLYTRIPFDFRHIETLNTANGQPYFSKTEYLLTIFRDIRAIHPRVSLTAETDYAVAFVIVESEVDYCG